MGHVIMMLCVHTPSLTNVIVGHLNKACLYTVPHFLMKSSSQSMEEYQKTLGFEIVDESSGKLEYFKSFAHRMSMGVAIYAAAAQVLVLFFQCYLILIEDRLLHGEINHSRKGFHYKIYGSGSIKF